MFGPEYLFLLVFPIIVIFTTAILQYYLRSILGITGVMVVLFVVAAFIVNQEYLIFAILYYLLALITGMITNGILKLMKRVYGSRKKT